MDEQTYYLLLERSKSFCRCLNVDYIDFLHDIICQEPIDEDNFKKLFVEKRYVVKQERLKAKLFTLEWQSVHGVKNPGQLSLYKYCRHCDTILPESEFYRVDGFTMNICKQGYLDKYRKPSKKIIREKPTKETVKLRSKTSQHKRRNELKDGYIIDLLKKNGYDTEDINNELIDSKRKQLQAKRSKAA
jgi:hypothetical protein